MKNQPRESQSISKLQNESLRPIFSYFSSDIDELDMKAFDDYFSEKKEKPTVYEQSFTSFNGERRFAHTIGYNTSLFINYGHYLSWSNSFKFRYAKQIENAGLGNHTRFYSREQYQLIHRALTATPEIAQYNNVSHLFPCQPKSAGQTNQS